MGNTKIYFDESGQTGCVLRNRDMLNFRTQPTFAVGALIVSSEQEEKKLLEKYKCFKRKYGIQDEIKGSSLLTRARNREVKYFIRHILDDSHFFVLLYDKRFYLSTLLLLGLYGFELQEKLIEDFYKQATMLSAQDDEFFLKYLEYIEKPSKEAFVAYLKFLIEYKYIELNIQENAVVIAAEQILSEHKEELCFDDFLSFGAYSDPKKTNVINLNAVIELIYMIKENRGFSNQQISYIHDHILDFEEIFKDELKDLGMDVSFEDSKNEELLQIIDNAVSIFRGSYDKMIRSYKNKTMWQEKDKWNMELFASLVTKVGTSHMNFTVPLNDWTFALCTAKMFSIDYPQNQRNNMSLSFHFVENLNFIFESIVEMQRPLKEVLRLLKK